MIGIFDSGAGGEYACNEVRRLLPRADILFLADRKNAPYGTKTPDELLKLVKRDVKRLRDAGADRILVACCTASTVLSLLDEDERHGVLPIISPSAEIAARLARVTVIATEHTVRSSAFKREINQISPLTQVQEIPCQRLVSLVENGAIDGSVTRECNELLLGLAKAARDHLSEGIILGCTHFSHLAETIRDLLPDLKIINPAAVGAKAISLCASDGAGNGKTIYTE